MLYHAMDITKVTDMTELVYLIMADGLNFNCFSISSRLCEVAMAAIPEPGKLIEVEANL